MKFNLLNKRKKPTTRREVAAYRQSGMHENLVQQSYRRNNNLNTRHTASPLESSERLATHELVKKRRRITRSLFFAIVAFVIIVILLFQMTISMSILTSDAKSASGKAGYMKIMEEYYSAQPIERFRFFLNHQNLANFFLEKAPEVKSVRVEGLALASSSVKLIFRQPVAQWIAGDKTYFVDENGVTFEKNYFTEPRVTIKDESSLPVDGGKEVINRQFLSFLGQAVAALSQNNLNVSEVVLPANTVRQIWFKVNNGNYYIKMTIDRAAGAQVGQAVKTINSLGVLVNRLAYIDVRVDQRSFYK